MADLKITMVKSTNRAKKNHCATMQALGLQNIGQRVTQADNEAIRGMVHNVAHLVKCEEV